MYARLDEDIGVWNLELALSSSNVCCLDAQGISIGNVLQFPGGIQHTARPPPSIPTPRPPYLLESVVVPAAPVRLSAAAEPRRPFAGAAPVHLAAGRAVCPSAAVHLCLPPASLGASSPCQPAGVGAAASNPRVPEVRWSLGSSA